MKLRLLPAIAAAIALSAFLFSSCKEDTIISASVTPAIDNIHTFTMDLDSLVTSTVYDDSALTSLNTTPAFAPLGWLNGDVYSGNTAASLYMQVIPPAALLSLADDPDSGFIILPYGGFTWGDTTNPSVQTYRAYAINESFSKDSLYYSFFKKSTDQTVIGSGALNITGHAGAQVDSVSVKNVKVTPHLRIELTHSFLHYLRSVLNGSTDSTFASFVTAFPGFYIVPDSSSNQRSLPYFRLDPIASGLYSQASMVLYKHADTVTYSFPLNPAYAAHFTRITRNYASPLAQQLFNPLPADAGTKLLLQNAPGASIDVRIPSLSKIPKNVIINKCELVITDLADAPGDVPYSRPPRILPVGVDSTGTRYTILDRFPTTTTEALDFIDGSPRTEGAYTRYHINFPRELQRAIVQGKSTLHLRIGGTATYPAAYRLLAGGGRHSDPQYRMALHIVYSKQ